MNDFKIDKKCGNARAGEYSSAHGPVKTPVFMNVATQSAIKGGLSSHDLDGIGCRIMLCNTYHLHVRPGENIIRAAGGLHGFTGRDKPILTDSGGFQVFSLAKMREISERGVSFASHVDGRKIFIGPEECMRIQSSLGSDIAMAFDECVENPSPRDYVEKSCARTTRWLERCVSELDIQNATTDAPNKNQALFGINQGGTYDDIRISHMKNIASMGLSGYAIGGLAVGEPADVMYRIIESVIPYMPEDKPRYLMGVGTPSNIIEAVFRGVDFFDCVMPARNARHGHLHTWHGRININNEKYAADFNPIDDNCGCEVCSKYSRAYLRHLLKAGEVLGLRLCVMHNLFFYNTLMDRIVYTINDGSFSEFRTEYSNLLDKRI